MMLDPYDRKSQFFCNDCRVVFGMQIACYNFRFYLQKRLESVDRLFQRFYRTEIFQIPYIRRRIETSIHSDTECILKFSACCQHLSFPRHCHHRRKRRISSGTADHIRLTLIKIHHRIICPDPDLTVMRKNQVTQMRQFLHRLFVIPADRCTGGIAARHYEIIRHLDSIVILE